MIDPCCAVPQGKSTAGLACPECGQGGKNVDLQTVKAMLLPEAMRGLDARSGFRFCAQPDCPVVYFSEYQALEKTALRVPVFQKDPSPGTPVCYCFGFAKDDIKGKASGKDISKTISAWVKGGLCACEIRNPQGSCCLGNIAQLP